MTAPETVVVTPAPRRRRTARTVVVVIGVLVVLVGLVIAADIFARQQVADFVEEKVRSALKVEADEPVAVEVGGVSVLAQLATGSLDDLRVDVESVAIGELTGGVSLRANGVPTDASNAVEQVDIELRVDEGGIQSLASTLSDSQIDSVQLVDGEIRFGTELSIFGVSFTVGLGVEPVADGGEITFTPTSVELGGTRSSAELLVETFGRPAEQLLQPRSLCAAEWLPPSLEVGSVEVLDDILVVTFGANDLRFDEASLSTVGSCD